MSEWLEGVEIHRLDVDGDLQTEHIVGYGGVTRIEAFTKSGMHAYIPYVRVWIGDVPAAEYCQHNIIDVHFKRGDAP